MIEPRGRKTKFSIFGIVYVQGHFWILCASSRHPPPRAEGGSVLTPTPSLSVWGSPGSSVSELCGWLCGRRKQDEALKAGKIGGCVQKDVGPLLVPFSGAQGIH